MATSELHVNVTPNVDRMIAWAIAVEHAANQIAEAMAELRNSLENLPDEHAA